MPALVFRRERYLLKLRVSDDDRIIIAGRNACAERLAVLLGEVCFGCNQNVGTGIKLLKFCTPLLGQRVRHDEHRLVRKSEPPQLHCCRSHRPCFARTDTVRKQRIAAVKDTGNCIFLVRI